MVQATRSNYTKVPKGADVRLLDALAPLRHRPRLVHLGTVLEYGPLPPDGTPRPDPAPEPTTPYGRAKLAASRAVLEAAASGAVRALVLRVSNVSGVGAPDVSLLGRVAERLVTGSAGGGTVTVELAPLRADRDSSTYGTCRRPCSRRRSRPPAAGPSTSDAARPCPCGGSWTSWCG
ncbi:hypothetical protein STANM309S_03402 [Streptomyces tanashiensis]